MYKKLYIIAMLNLRVVEKVKGMEELTFYGYSQSKRVILSLTQNYIKILVVVLK